MKKDGISVAKNNERLLSAWLRLSVIVCNERVVSDMPYNEALICSLLVKAGECRMTATELCEKTKMFKSQMNRTLHSLEEKNLVTAYEREVSGKVRKYYSITKEGNHFLRKKKEEWKEYTAGVEGVIGGLAYGYV